MPNVSDPLQGLRDVHLPDPISWWPPALGWWIIIGLLVLGGSLLMWTWVYRQRTRPRRFALAQLQDVRQQYVECANDQLAIMQLSRLVRQMALATFPRSQVAGLSGQSWLQFLDSTGNTNQFSNGPGQALQAGPYQQRGSDSAADLIPVIERWIQQQKIPQRKSLG